MREAIQFYRDVHRDFLWLHFAFIIILLYTSVYWFITPIYIVQYGAFEPTIMLKILLAITICVLPALVVTLHCWLISFIAAKKWIVNTKIMSQSVLRWWLIFQTVSIFVVVGFTTIILALFLVVDVLRYLF